MWRIGNNGTFFKCAFLIKLKLTYSLCILNVKTFLIANEKEHKDHINYILFH